ncbi:MAG: hypothetical protein ICV72_13865 [Aldersonia sp.]|nr:hypothetical protein [Aldersonia sp.]
MMTGRAITTEGGDRALVDRCRAVLRDRPDAVVGPVALSLVTGVLVTHNALFALVVLVAVPLLFVIVRVPSVSSAALLLLAVPLMRPMILGEDLSAVATILALAAALLAWIDDRGSVRSDAAARTLVIFVAAIWAWILLLLSARTTFPVGDTLRGLVTVPVTVAAATIVLRNERRRTLVLKGVVAATIALCASYAVTYLLWRAGGYDFARIGRVRAGYEGRLTPLYAPFTATYSTVSIGGIPRFLGIAREPGMMAALLAWAFFMLPRIGWERRRWQLLIVVGLLGTQSTAGFGVFLMVWVSERFILRSGRSAFGVFLRRSAGVAVAVLAGWIAWYAPVFGVQAKTDFNQASVDVRSIAMDRGIQAVTQHPWGQDLVGADAVNSAINIVASIAVLGIPGFLLGASAVALPAVLSRQRRQALAPIGVILCTVAVSQPLTHSTALLLAVALAAASYTTQEPPGGTIGPPPPSVPPRKRLPVAA